MEKLQIDIDGEFPALISLKNKNYVVLPENEYIRMQKTISEGNSKILYGMLEKEIMHEMPKDIDDVFVVAKVNLDNLKEQKKDIGIQDIKKIIKDIKLNYPNLFMSLDDYELPELPF